MRWPKRSPCRRPANRRARRRFAGHRRESPPPAAADPRGEALHLGLNRDFAAHGDQSARSGVDLQVRDGQVLLARLAQIDQLQRRQVGQPAPVAARQSGESTSPQVVCCKSVKKRSPAARQPRWLSPAWRRIVSTSASVAGSCAPACGSSRLSISSTHVAADRTPAGR